MQDAYALAAILVAPLVGALLTGLDRRITARMQGRMGPPVLQPLYDVLKLFSKESLAAQRFQVVAVSLYLMCTVLSLLLVALGQDLLMMLFVLAAGGIAVIVGGFSVKSPYSQLGSQREIMQMLAYEPLLIFLVIGIYLRTGSFLVRDVVALPQPLIVAMPLFVVTMIIVMGIKLRKSPFDISASHHAHQEVVRGLFTEYGGPILALVEITHWYELVLLLSLVGLLWASTPLAGVLLALACYFLVLVMDNVSARMTWHWMVRVGWRVGVPLAVANLVMLYFLQRP